MLGLIKKDLLMIRGNFKLLAILFFVYGFMAIEGQVDLSYVLPFMSVMIMISTFSYDAYNKWDAYAISLPDGRKNSVRAKYTATLLLILVTTLITTALTIIVSYVRTKSIDLENVLLSMMGAVFATAILQSFMYPAIYKFGLEKARIGIFILVFGIAFILGIIARFVDFESLFQTLDIINDYWAIILPIVMIMMLYISYKISEGIFNKKEY